MERIGIITSGVTVANATGGTVEYMKTEEARRQRFVDLKQVALYEALGICFGRKSQPYAPTFEEVSGAIRRIF